MRISKYEKYLSGLSVCTEKVGKALENGALLTDMELVDYYAKCLLNGENLNYIKLVKDKLYRIANLLSDVIDIVEELRVEGYSNEDVVFYASKVCKYAFMYRLSSRLLSISGYDSNSSLFIELCCGKDILHTFEITGKSDVSSMFLILVSYLASEKLAEGEFKTFIENYAVNVFNDIRKVVKPTPYVYKGTAKTLNSYICKECVPVEHTEESKILKFRVG